MTYKTHFVGGVCATALTSLVMPIENMLVVGAVSAVSALLPDIDIEGSKVNNKAGVIGKGISAVSKHRGFIHTPILYIVLYFLFSVVFPQSICMGFLIGTMSHLILDTFNYKGIMWFYPLTHKHYHIASIKTRSVGETIFLAVMIVVSVLLFANSQTIFAETMGVVDFINFDVPSFDTSSFLNKCERFIKAMIEI